MDEGAPGVAPPKGCLALGLLLFGELGQLSNLLFLFIIFILLLVFFFGFEGVLLGGEFFTLPWVRRRLLSLLLTDGGSWLLLLEGLAGADVVLLHDRHLGREGRLPGGAALRPIFGGVVAAKHG